MDNKKKWSFITQWVLEGTSSIAFIGGIGISIIAAAIVIDVLMRWLFNAPILGVDDLSIYMLAVVVSSFFPAGMAQERFVTIRFAGKALGPGRALWLEVFGAFCTLAFFMLLAWKILFYSVGVTQSGMASIVLQWPQAPWWWMVTLIFIVCIPVQAIILIKNLKNAIRGPDSSTGPGNHASATDPVDFEDHPDIKA